jgi:UDP-N-acetylglucosamine/UDP-N-acetylgalactosamine diphosphorylase
MTENQVVSNRLSNWNQEHLLKYWNELTTREQTHLQNEILGIDFDHFDKLFKQAENNKSLETRIDYEKNSTKELQIDRFYQMKPHDLNRYELEGLKAISQGHVAVIVLAGGLSSRLSISYPKGMFSIDSLSSKTLFQLQAERLVRLKQIAHEKYPSISGIRLPWYIMTSEHTHSATVDFFQENNYFGLDCNEVVVFKQAMWPCMTTGNKMILDTKCSIKKAPNGNGGLYKALVDNQILQSMSKNYGTKHVHVYGVENILVKIADPVFTGYCVKNKAECAAKVKINKLWTGVCLLHTIKPLVHTTVFS